MEQPAVGAGTRGIIATASKLPVRKEVEMTAPDGNRYKFTFTDFEWDPTVADPAKLFSTEPPEGYTVRDATRDGQ